MRKTISFFISSAMVLAGFGSLLAMPTSVLAASQNAVYDSLTGTVYPTGGTTPDAVAVPDDEQFIQMDVGSAIVLKFSSPYVAMPDGTATPDLEINTYDTLYPASAEISVSFDGVTYTSLGVYSDTTNIDLNLESYGPVKYVKVDQGSNYIDPTYPTLGFDLDAVIALNSIDETQLPTTGTLTIVKNTVGGDGTFNFVVAGPTASTPQIITSSNTGTTNAMTVNTGIYNVTEGTLPTGWIQTSVICSNGEASNLDPANLTVNSGDSITCTFTNTYTPPTPQICFDHEGDHHDGQNQGGDKDGNNHDGHDSHSNNDWHKPNNHDVHDNHRF